ncbi:MAG: LacI family transcriptional regulator [Lawsonibacter sp.]|nr:LacI family transcriptional regulator [Lawsonibacter sp.]
MTIKDIAKLANVSPGTVSKIINGKADNIRPATREHVLNIVRQYHYSPGNFIRQSSVSRTYKIGLFSPFWPENMPTGYYGSASPTAGRFPIN